MQQNIINLALGYPRVHSGSLSAIMASAAQNVTLAQEAEPFTLFHDFAKDYFQYAGQNIDEKKVLPTSSASQAISLAAKLLQQEDCRRIGIIYPRPDFIRDLLENEGLETVQIGEDLLYNKTHAAALENLDALYLILPNNPTGIFPDADKFRALMRQAKAADIPVVIDFCFRLYGPLHQWDQYRILKEEGVKFIGIEDTGKSLAAGGLKVGMMVSHPDFHHPLKKMSEMFGPPSPLTIQALKILLSQAGATPEELPLRAIVKKNRQTLVDSNAVEIELLLTNQTCNIGFAQTVSAWPSSWAREALENAGVQTTSLTNYYNCGLAGKQGVRIALAVSPETIAEAVTELAKSQKSREEFLLETHRQFCKRW